MILLLDARLARELATAIALYARWLQQQRGKRISPRLAELHRALTRYLAQPAAEDVRSDVRMSGRDYPSGEDVPHDRIAVKNAAERLGFSSRHLRRLVEAGELAAPVRDGNRTWFSQHDLDDYLDRRAARADQRPESHRAGEEAQPDPLRRPSAP